MTVPQKGVIRTVQSVPVPVLSSAGFTLGELREAVQSANAAFKEIEALGLPDDTQFNFRRQLDGGEFYWSVP